MIGWVRHEPGRGTIEPDASGRQWQGPAPAMVAARRWVLVMLIPLSVTFALVIAAYLMRRLVPDWQPLALPWQLWLSTALLLASSAAFEWARRAAAIAQAADVRRALWTAGLLAIAFLATQFWSWQALRALGAFMAASPAASFFYMMTALHAAHLVGGLVAWSRATALSRRDDAERLHHTVSVCAIYWHFLLAVWLVLFGVLLVFS
jgi:cytochrome c oxidase subunit III